MNNTQDEKIISAFLEGRIMGLPEFGRKPECLQTMISRVFLFSTTVFKLYRKDSEIFNTLFSDLGGDIRRSFYEEDFFFNHYFNPAVYKFLRGVKVGDGVELCEPDDKNAYDLVIQMDRIDVRHNLTEQLLNGTLQERDFHKIGYEMTKCIAEFPYKLKTDKNYYEIYYSFLKDLVGWTDSAAPFIPKEEARRVFSVLFPYLEGKKDELSHYTSKDFVSAIDNHSDNVFYKNGELSFIDVYLPKESWRAVMPSYNSVRLSTDIQVLHGKKYADALLAGYGEYYPEEKRDPGFDMFQKVYMALIKGPYLFIMNRESRARHDEAQKYWEFIKKSVAMLE
ncbi:MAG: hypothetical protein A3H71_02845 [Candidatus Sungbacteria bacterium RIFCSPLOWO2_02_FULL_48_13b]|uniref:Aminoglycoside phosphotransferase domain-containing protein n=2 Tax=Candidatus Sungiibacteriota TaxID=1817917 RepID=A0A1G2LGE6_9BACT|nr:MAG: hypothetical protein A3C12_01740 [Candidatus Sungbacteria bacterium RIFCSPHIGHO2_02_FULL_49_20]OHA09889.1 MAG: hypothetical protein A3H71_02845 [Candidatus Sungbacteria bacterium RIFCSPLOWO2_02_FULL_48_13b]